MTRLYADGQQRQHRQVTFRVDQKGALKAAAESMSSLSDVSDELPPPPDDDVDAGLISRVYGLGRKPTTIALTFRPPRKQRAAHKLPKPKTTKQRSCGRPGNVTSPEGDACHSDVSHVTCGRHTGTIATSKSMHSLSKTNPEVNHCTTLPAAGGNGIKTLSECRRSVTSSSKAIERRTANGLASSDWKLNRGSNDNGSRATSCPVPHLTVTAAAAENEAKHHVCPSRHDVYPGVTDLGRRLSTPTMPSLARPAVAVDRLSPGRGSVCADLPSKPRLDLLFNTHGDLAKFRQLLRESTDETASEQRVNYCCEVTTARIEAWLRAVRSARRTAGGLCRRTADESLESEQTIMKLRNDNTEPDAQQ